MKTIVCFENHRKDGKVAAVRHRGRWHRFTNVVIDVPTVTRYTGRGRRQPVFYVETQVNARLETVRMPDKSVYGWLISAVPGFAFQRQTVSLYPRP